MRSMLDFDPPKMKQIDIIGVHVQAAEGENVCDKIPNTVSVLRNMCVVWKMLDLGESNAPQIGPIW